MNRFIKTLKSYDPSLTVGELVSQLEFKSNAALRTEQNTIEEVKNEFKDTYLRQIDEDRIFGKSLYLYHIQEIPSTGRDTNYSILYNIKGTKLVFSGRDMYLVSVEPEDIDSSFSLDKLRLMKKITKEDYEFHLNHYTNITNTLKGLIK